MLKFIQCSFCSLGIAPVGNRISCRRSPMAAATVTKVGIVLQQSSYSLGQLIAGRILCGIGNVGVNSEITQRRVTR